MRALDVPNISLEEKMAAFTNAEANGQKYYSVIEENASVSVEDNVRKKVTFLI